MLPFLENLKSRTKLYIIVRKLEEEYIFLNIWKVEGFVYCKMLFYKTLLKQYKIKDIYRIYKKLLLKNLVYGISEEKC